MRDKAKEAVMHVVYPQCREVLMLSNPTGTSQMLRGILLYSPPCTFMDIVQRREGTNHCVVVPVMADRQRHLIVLSLMVSYSNKVLFPPCKIIGTNLKTEKNYRQPRNLGKPKYILPLQQS